MVRDVCASREDSSLGPAVINVIGDKRIGHPFRTPTTDGNDLSVADYRGGQCRHIMLLSHRLEARTIRPIYWAGTPRPWLRFSVKYCSWSN
jgi:hypothetical protein